MILIGSAFRQQGPLSYESPESRPETGREESIEKSTMQNAGEQVAQDADVT
jgi:hypothetical protein